MRINLGKCPALALTFGAVVSLYGFGARPVVPVLGSIEAERTRALPGDEIPPRSRRPAL